MRFFGEDSIWNGTSPISSPIFTPVVLSPYHDMVENTFFFSFWVIVVDRRLNRLIMFDREPGPKPPYLYISFKSPSYKTQNKKLKPPKTIIKMTKGLFVWWCLFDKGWSVVRLLPVSSTPEDSYSYVMNSIFDFYTQLPRFRFCN